MSVAHLPCISDPIFKKLKARRANRKTARATKIEARRGKTTVRSRALRRQAGRLNRKAGVVGTPKKVDSGFHAAFGGGSGRAERGYVIPDGQVSKAGPTLSVLYAGSLSSDAAGEVCIAWSGSPDKYTVKTTTNFATWGTETQGGDFAALAARYSHLRMVAFGAKVEWAQALTNASPQFAAGCKSYTSHPTTWNALAALKDIDGNEFKTGACSQGSILRLRGRHVNQDWTKWSTSETGGLSSWSGTNQLQTLLYLGITGAPASSVVGRFYYWANYESVPDATESIYAPPRLVPSQADKASVFKVVSDSMKVVFEEENEEDLTDLISKLSSLLLGKKSDPETVLKTISTTASFAKLLLPLLG